MSAYVICMKLFAPNPQEYLFRAFTKRYFRLMIPVLGSVLFVYLLHQQNLMYNTKLTQYLGSEYTNAWTGKYYTFPTYLLEAIKYSLWDTFFIGVNINHTYNIVLWTMKPEFFGSMFCLMLFGVIGKNQQRLIFYLTFAVIAFMLRNYWLVSFLLGLLMSDIDFGSNTKVKNRLNIFFAYPLINLSIFIFLLVLGGKIKNYAHYNTLISAFIVVLITKTAVLQKILEFSPLVWLGKISFSLYLIHYPIICSFACYLYIKLPLGGHYSKFLVVGCSTVTLSIIMAYFFTLFIDRKGIKLANYIADRLSQYQHH